MLLLFDLDGTLTDSAPGIVRSVNHALGVLGHPPVPEDDIRSLIGAPLSQIFAHVLGPLDRDTMDRGIAAYRERFNDIGVFENRVYPGIPGALADLGASGGRLQVVTAKPVASARRVLEHFGLAGHFEAVRGSDPGARAFDKADLVAAALSARRADPARAAMIGDRADDVKAGHAHGTLAVGVEWGYGGRDELVAARPAYIAPGVADLADWLGQAIANGGAPPRVTPTFDTGPGRPGT
ncbi:MAG: HAD hydrolase-like protein [Vicinamibacterales bacterium]